MNNKTSDKNVAIIEELIQEYKTYNDLDGIQDLSIYVNALENILADYTRQKQINEEHQRINGELREKVKELDTKNDELLKDLYSANCIIADLTDSIPIQNIIEKIEELDRKEQELQNSISEEEREEYEDANISYLLCDIEIRREVLKELLQESEDK